MPSALENLIKILKLEQRNGYANKTVIGGLRTYAPNWAQQAHDQARQIEQHALIEEIVTVIADYDREPDQGLRSDLARYMLDRIMRRCDPLPEYSVDLARIEELYPASEETEETAEYDGAKEDLSSQPEDRWEDDDDDIDEYDDADSFAGTKEPERAERRPAPAKSPKKDTSGPRPKPRFRPRKSFDLEKARTVLSELDNPLTVISGVGDAMAEKFQRLGASTIGDLLYLFPRRYDDYTRLLPLRKAQPDIPTTVIGTIRGVIEQPGRGGRGRIVVTIDDGTATMDIAFFNQTWLKRQLKIGMQVVFSGKTSLFLGRITMINPEWEPVDQEQLHTGGIVPVYPLTKGISARTMRRIMKKLIDQWDGQLPDHLPDSVLERAEQAELSWAIRQMHFPESWEYLDYARERLAFDQLVTLQMGMLANRAAWQSQAAQPLPVSDDWLAGFQDTLPFSLTNAQLNAIETIRADLAQEIPMNRLLQGDVGSGKTLVAAVALASALINDKQAALMAPTSILAEQHYQNLSELLPQIPGLEHISIGLLTGALSDSERGAVYAGIESGEIRLVVGTHAVIQEGVSFADLGVAVIDEQHRFGVAQRGVLRGKGTNPHLLVMSATPIPRTLALTVHADLDLTVLDEMPPGRTPIQTKLLNPSQRTRSYEFIERTVLAKGQQVYVIYPLIESSDSIDAESAVDGFEMLKEEIYPKYELGLLHGRMRPAEKDAVMEQFAAGEIDVLVSTTVIEVGIDVPNATAILIEGAERFGLAQLHQLRGRVGRGDQKSYCMLISNEKSERLQALEETTDGFKLAELDWQLRGAGDLLGLRQSGPGAAMMSAIMDSRLVALAQQESRALFAEDPLLSLPEHRLLAERSAQVRDRRTDVS